MAWVFAERPGQTGDKKAELTAKWDQMYGQGRWRKRWIFDGNVVTKLDFFRLCEFSYFLDSLRRQETWERLAAMASDVYDKDSREITSGLDYGAQLEYTRFHDICIRRVFELRELKFSGDELVQIRWDEDNPTWASDNFDPGRVPFFNPDLIKKPEILTWFNQGSIESAYQNCKILEMLID